MAAVGRLGARPKAWARTTARVMYRDAEGSWILSERSQTMKQVWRTDYAAIASVDWAPFRMWCRSWRYPAVMFAAGTDSAKFFLIHPVRGPLFLTAVGAGVGAVVWG